MSWPVITYIVEEVTRQGHDITMLDGIERVGWMIEAWCYAIRCSDKGLKPELFDVIRIGQMIEPRKNAKGLRREEVRVGRKQMPLHANVKPMMDYLFEHREEHTPMEFYKSFQEIHPFLGGNAEAGKVLLAWYGQTLMSPEFPPNDLFGHPVDNP